MASKNKALDLTIKISGQLDKSFSKAIADASKQTSSLSKVISNIGKAGLAVMATGLTTSTAAIIKATDAAAEFENQMADVVKYVEGLADNNGAISDTLALNGDGKALNGKTYAQNYETMKEAILDLSAEIPYTAEELTRLAAAAGQSGYDIEELLKISGTGNSFLKDVAMWGTAMDIDADTAGDWAAKWEVALGMTHEGVMELADQINYLGANHATTAAEIAEVVNETASMGQIAGVDADTTAALATAILAMGVSADVTGTSIKRMYTNISMGENATDAIAGAFSTLGMDVEQVAKDMQVDGVGTFLTIFERLEELAPEKQIATLKNLFGQWAIESGAKLTGNLDEFRKTLEEVNGTDWEGSMMRELIIKTDTPEAVDTMVDNSINRFMVKMGTAFLPVRKELGLSLLSIFDTIDENTPQLTKLANSIVPLIRQGTDALTAAIERAIPVIQKFFDYLGENPDDAIKKISTLATIFAGMSFAPNIESLLFGAAGGVIDLLFGKEKIYPSGSKARSGGFTSLFQGGMADMILGKTRKRKDGTTTRVGGILGSITGRFSAAKDGVGGYFNSLATTDFGSRLLAGGDTFRTMSGEILSGIGQATGITDLINGVAGGATGLFGKAKSGIGGAFSSATTKLGKTSIGGLAPLGEIGSNLAGVFSGAFGGIGTFATTALGPIAGALGSVFSGVAPVILAISTVIALFSILGDNLEGIRTLIGNTFGEQGLVIFDTFTSKVSEVLNFLSGLLGGGFIELLKPAQDAITNMFGADAGNAFGGVTQVLQSVIDVIGQIVTFAVTTVKPIILDLFNFITTTVAPIILQTITAAAPYISAAVTNAGTAIMNAMTLIGDVIQTLMPYLQTIATVILNVFAIVTPAVMSGLSVLTGGLVEITGSVQQVFNGVIDFITGVFTGNWEQAWQGVSNIFDGIFSGLVTLVKTPLNAIISLVNTAIDGINDLIHSVSNNALVQAGAKLAGIEDIGTFNIGHIPMLANGGFTNGPSLAGEDGREAVISFDRSVRSSNIATWLKAGNMLGALEKTTFPEIGSGSGGDITFAPQIIIQGSADEATVEAALVKAQAKFEQWYYEMQKRKMRVAF